MKKIQKFAFLFGYQLSKGYEEKGGCMSVRVRAYIENFTRSTKSSPSEHIHGQTYTRTYIYLRMSKPSRRDRYSRQNREKRSFGIGFSLLSRTEPKTYIHTVLLLRYFTSTTYNSRSVKPAL